MLVQTNLIPLGTQEFASSNKQAHKCPIYSIWSERNMRLHRQQFRSVNSILSSMNATIRNRSSSFRELN
ncbi:unnamed protein product, partial [Arabidopsis halleri]